MVKRTGHADLPLHHGTVPRWLADRMRDLGTEIIEALLLDYGKKEVLSRLSDPLWFQSFGAVLGMDWHSSGITTSVMYALKRGINARARELGLCVCGGRGKYSRRTPDELLYLAEHTGLDGDSLVRASRLSAKIDNTAVQDGFQLYQHNFILSDEGDWAVVQQGMSAASRTARRYHWSSEGVRSFVEEPHAGVTGENMGTILNLTDRKADAMRAAILTVVRSGPGKAMEACFEAAAHPLANERSLVTAEQLELFSDEMQLSGRDLSVITNGRLSESEKLTNGRSLDIGPAPLHAVGLPNGSRILPTEEGDILIDGGSRSVVLPAHHDVRAEDVDTKRLGAVLAAAYEAEPADFESLLLTPGLGPRTLQSLALVSEVIHGTPGRFRDPARFSFAHGGKDGHPFPVPTRIYDESIRILGDSIEKSKMGYKDKSDCLRRLHRTSLEIEENCSPEADFDAVVARERENSANWGGRTCGGSA